MKITLAIILTLLLFSITNGRIIHVPDDEETIQAGIDEAEDGDTVLVQRGMYYENIDFRCKAIVVASRFLTTGNLLDIQETIIDCNRNGRSVVCIWLYEDENTVLTGFTIQNGRTSYGGGIHISDANPTLTHLCIINNTATEGGGGIYCTGGAPSISNVIIYGNYSSRGSGIHVSNGACPVLENVTIEHNRSDFGGGVYCENAELDLREVTITRNRSSEFGGGIFCYRNSHITIGTSTIYNNRGNSLYIHSSTVVLNKIVNCDALYFTSGSGLTITNSIILNSPIYHPPDSASSDIEISYTDYVGGQENLELNDNVDLIWGEGNIDADPMFGPPGAFSLTGLSPCIDAGDPNAPSDPDGTRADMGACYYRHSGFICGYVLDAADNEPLINSLINIPYFDSTHPDSMGYWWLFAPVEEFDITASHPGYFDSTLTELNLEPQDTLEITFGLLHPEISLSEQDIERQVRAGEEIVCEVELMNSGNGQLEWQSECHPLRINGIAPWDLRMTFLIGQLLMNNCLNGVTFVDGRFYVAATVGWEEENIVYVLDSLGNCVECFPQFRNTPFGMYDLTWDGELIWGGDDRRIIGFSPNGELVTAWDAPINSRNIAWDPDRELLWINNITSNIAGFSRDGERRIELNSRGLRMYGLAYCSDDPDGYPLYLITRIAHETENRIYKMNPDNGDTMFVTVLPCNENCKVTGGFISIDFDGQLPKFICICDIERDDGGDRLQVHHIGCQINWLELEPAEGELGVNEIVDIELFLMANRLTEAVYDGEIEFFDNITGQDVILPITLTVNVNEFANEEKPTLPQTFSLTSVYPNPFNSFTNISFTLPMQDIVSLRIFNIAGREVMNIDERIYPAGWHSMTLNADRLPAGVYLVNLYGDCETRNWKVVLLR